MLKQLDVSLTAMSTAEFSLFPQLPAELRRMIWLECLPFRVFEADLPNWLIESACQLRWATYRNGRCLVIGHVCRESRSIALESGSFEEYSQRWFAPSRDIPFLHWTPIVGIEEEFFVDCVVDISWYAQRGIAGILAERLRDFYSDSTRFDWAIDDFAEISKIKNYLVAVKVVVLHLPLEMAVHSGLFGRLGEEAIKLVDMADTETIQKYQELWASSPRRDFEPEPFFNRLDSLQKRVPAWVREVEELWLRYKWSEARKADWHGVEQPRDIWLGPGTKDDDELQKRLSRRFPEDLTEDLDYGDDYYHPNREHPFVQKVLHEMPCFQPRVMFRHCHRNCHIPELRWTGG
jgi:hypothetical protein